MDKKTNTLNQSEWIVMEQLWDRHPQTITQLFHTLRENPGWSKSTVNTMLGRMVDKGFLHYEEGEKAKQYYPSIQKEEVAIAETESLIERVYKGSVSLMMNTLVKEKDLSREEIDELYAILRGLEAKKHD